MLSHLSQNSLLVDNLEEAALRFRQLFDTRFTRGAVLPRYQVRNVVSPLGRETFMEILEAYDPDAPSRRHLARHGPHPWLLGAYSNDVDGLATRLEAEGVKLLQGRHTYFIHPSHTPGLFIHVVNETFDGPGPSWTELPPSTVVDGLMQVVVVVNDLAATSERYMRWFGLELKEREETSGYKAARLALQRSHIVLLQGLADHHPITRFSRRHGQLQYATCLRVRDLDAAKARVEACGVRVSESEIPLCPGLLIDPEATFGLRFLLSE